MADLLTLKILKEESLNTMIYKFDKLYSWLKDVPFDNELGCLSNDMLQLHYLSKKKFPMNDTLILLHNVEYKGLLVYGDKGSYSLVYLDASKMKVNLKEMNYLDMFIPIEWSETKIDLFSLVDSLDERITILDFSMDLPRKETTLAKLRLLFEYKMQKDITEIPNGFYSAQSYNKILKKSGLYIFLNENCEIIYIGKAKSLHDRVKTHVTGASHTKDYCDDFVYVSIFYLDDYEEHADTLERDFIRNLNPKRNVVFSL